MVAFRSPWVDEWQRDLFGGNDGTSRGVEVPFKLPRMVGDEKAAQEFAENARKSLQR
jgi:hypothetical protein